MLIAIAQSHTKDAASLEIDRNRYRWWIRSRQACGKDRGTNIAGDLTHTDIEAEVRVFSLGDADSVVERCGQVSTAGDDVLQILGGVGLLGETGCRDDGSLEWAGERDADPTEETACEPSALATDAVDCAIGELQAKVKQEGHGRMQPRLGCDGVDVLIVVGIVRAESELSVKMPGNEVVAGTYDKACGQTRRPWSELAIFQCDNLAVEDVHSVVVPQFAESAIGYVGAVAESVNAAGIAELGTVGEAFGEVDGLDVANDLGGIDKVVTESRVRKEMTFFGVDHVGSGSDKSTGLALERELLSVGCDRNE